MSLPDLPGIISSEELLRTADTIAEWQLPNGMIPWFPGGHGDPWNHVEAAMALAVMGNFDAAEQAYQWLVDTQHDHGAWHQYYLADNEVEDPKFDGNVVAYVATGAWHHYLRTEDLGFLETMWKVVEPAIEFTLGLQTPRGEILWARHADGTPWSFALLTGSASICHSLRCAIAIAETLGQERPDWELSLGRLAEVVRTRPDGAFAPKHRWAMDWYYPVLSGAVSGEAGREHLAERWDQFVTPERGVRCVNDKTWFTAAETCECALAHLAVGEREKALDLYRWAQVARQSDGRYWTGIVYPQRVTFPTDERTTYTSAAIVLAADALADTGPASRVLWDHSALPEIIEVVDHDPISERD